MKSPNPNNKIAPLRKRPSKRVIVSIVREQPRPFFSLILGSCLHRPADWADIGFDRWRAEQTRRKKIHELMTDQEREFFDKYCSLRDD